MKCSKCEITAVINASDAYCKEHFFEYLESTVQETISRFNLIKKSDKIAVACSGGKDSTILLALLKKWDYNVEALAIDEGIAGYRDKTLDDLRLICADLGVKLNIVSYQEQLGTTLDAYLLKNKSARACTSCGVWRRHLLNKFSQGYDAIATGHNLDDEAQSILMNLLKSNVQVLARLGPKSGIIAHAGFTPRVKPLYFIHERETAAYALLKGLSVQFTECPNAAEAFRSSARDGLNDLEAAEPGSKRNLVDWFLANLPELKQKFSQDATALLKCKECGEPTTRDICKSCSQEIELIYANPNRTRTIDKFNP